MAIVKGAEPLLLYIRMSTVLGETLCKQLWSYITVEAPIKMQATCLLLCPKEVCLITLDYRYPTAGVFTNQYCIHLTLCFFLGQSEEERLEPLLLMRENSQFVSERIERAHELVKESGKVYSLPRSV